ncbi:zinc transporter 2-like [Dendronephthya gigantea]|uniref:zinc transporter 2-like n=1 Tax=Dendronephthya gigantea TaxID=151771 RepID=UPI00106B6B0A|nr:zinc transporter 2-like [Dendronephthya gigantea]
MMANLDKEPCPVNSDTEIKHETSKARTQLFLATFVCIVFIAVEVAGGYLANSLAIISDAAHMMSDLASLLTSILAINIAAWPATKSHTFGFYRAEIIGALLTIFIGWVVSAFLSYYAIERIVYHDYEIEADTMVLTAGFCLIANILMGLILVVPGRSHGHSHGGKPAMREVETQSKEELQNINIRAAFIHILGDTLCTLGLLIAAVIIKFRPELTIADPICTLLFSIMSVLVSLNVFKDIMKVFLEGTPDQFTYDEVKNSLESISGVTQVHSLRLWSLTVDLLAANVHLRIDESASENEVLYTAKNILKQEYRIKFVCIQVENKFESWIEIHNQAKMEAQAQTSENIE